ncbi:DUF6443 domain-containing protein [Flavobacterium dankookense]|uniref:RHS repeat-associated protein n=1 Tax=Flavobacterium dankookense TaxID=706186 RepID=A0A4R6QBF1_9FLAO|nr:DUF6443 domain-containing protein [Flavobacterium dankookense]TDP58619.1 RHS repeat-associated protein [Flavobacterium dankookense]
MKKLLFITATLFSFFAYGQLPSSDQNYIKNTTYKVPTTVTPNPTDAQKTQSITYFDGLGRPIQQIAKAQSATAKDIITHIEYDGFGRQTMEYLPFASQQNTMLFMDSNTLKQEQATQYQTWYGDVNPYSEKRLENSPLNRVLEQAAPGNDWAMNNAEKHTIRFDYQTNVANEVKLYKATATWVPAKGLYEIALVNETGSVYYEPNQLYKTITKNENWKTADGDKNTTVEFKDKEGRVVLKRTYGSSIINNAETAAWHDTYYVYDIFGNLTYVIPPLVNTSLVITNDVLNDLCYQYQYDYRNRLVEKKLPGKQWEFIVYDKLDRVVMTGPALSPFTDLTGNGWMITKYDVFSRPILTAWMPGTVTSTTRKTNQDNRTSATLLNESKTTSNTTVNYVGFMYTNLSLPTSDYHVLTVNYYDNYDSGLLFSPTISYSVIHGQTLHNNTTSKPIGLPTVSWVRVPETSTLYKHEKSYTLYDTKGREIRTYKNNYLGGYTQTDKKLQLITGRVDFTETRHKRVTADAEIFVKDVFTYTDQERLLTHTHQIGTSGTPQLLAKNEYDELGQLISKQVGGTDTTTFIGLQKVDYSYNIRGWLKSINNINALAQSGNPTDLFAFKLNYNNVENESVYAGTKLYNGNISETYWRTNNDDVKRKYSYNYDELSRLKNAVYQRPEDASPLRDSYNESLSYDKNGNIKALQRNGEYDDVNYAFQIDQLEYTYHPTKHNQLMKVVDESINPNGFKDVANDKDDYSYDANGNMTIDNNKGITAITYNHLNLPTKITFGTSGRVEYLYNAFGSKVKKSFFKSGVFLPTVTDYLDGFQYAKVASAVVKLDFFPHAEGYVKNTVVGSANVYKYAFNYTDHLGNVRLSYGLNSENVLTVLEENNYYPFGLKHENYNVTKKEYDKYDGEIDLRGCVNCSYKYKYNGKEYQDELGLNMYDYGARNYDPAIGRWMNIDPHSDTYFSISNYGAFVNNPISFIDPTGKDILFWRVNQKSGEWEQVKFNQLDKNIQKGIEDFGKTKAGYEFLSSFANKGDKIGSLSFDKDGKYSNHDLQLNQVEGETGYEGRTNSPVIRKDKITFGINLNKDIESPQVNVAETLGHEAFLHQMQTLDGIISAFKKGGAGAAMDYDLKDFHSNPSGYKDHLALKDDVQGRAKRYFTYISQLKTVLNPIEVQKVVNKDIKKSYSVGVQDTPKKR